MKNYFARHGQTDWNILRKVQGTTDIPLNENGILQAQNLCEYLKEKGISFEKIYASYQLRARQTAQECILIGVSSFCEIQISI